MLVRDIMVTRVHTIAPEASLASAARKMRDENVGALLVMSGGKVIGVVTDRDLVVRALAEGARGDTTKVREAMSASVHGCLDEHSVEDAMQTMTRHQLRRLPVFDRRNQLVGIVSLSDLAGGQLKSKPFQVVFYKEVTTSTGHPQPVRLATIYISPDHPIEEVKAAAIQKFEADHRVGCWQQIADRYEIIGPADERPAAHA